MKTLMLLVSLFGVASVVAAQSPPPIIYPAGVYTVTTPSPTVVTYSASSVTFSWTVTPTPTPVPPAPTPDPVPTLTGHLWALVIYDPAVPLTAAQTAALSSATLKAAALLQDVDVQSFKSTDPSVASWKSSYSKTGLPALLFVQKSATGQGVLGYGAVLPASEADILTLVNQVRGK